ncbi:MAG: lipase family protein [Clostridia bacterium]|nr:lipase family protein [Clostridia bacterium]
MKLYALFFQCLHIPYSNAGVSASYATRRESDTLYLYFQGSEGKNDWKNNLDFPVKAYKRMSKTVWFAHRGFLKVWKELEPILAPVIADTSVKKIVVCGYSHGAAIAALCHEYIWYNRPDLRENIEGYGFGSPRVFWGVCTKELKSRFQRFTVIRNINDLVTHLPPAFLGYRHVGKLLEIGKKGNYSALEAHYAENILKELKLYETAAKSE